MSRESEEDIEAADREETLSVPDVKPVRSVSELSKKSFARRRRRADRVIYLFGSFLVLVLAIALFQFLWKYWVEDIFSPANRIALPEFVGMDYETLINDPDMLDRYNFEVTYVVDAGSPPNRVLKQDPKPGRSVMVVPSGIQVRLEVSTYSSQVAVPDLVDRYYVDALLLLQNAGFNCEIENATSDTVGRDYVIASSPSAGEELSYGSTVYLTVSSGPEILTVDVPNLVGISEDAAKAKLEASRLSFGSVERVTSDFEAGTVIGQIPEAFTQIEEHAKITLIISAGPGEQDD